jgi:purine-binding chemotaxis protein CheW
MSNMGNSVADPISVQDQNSQYLTFMLGGEEYGVNILSVQEIKSGEETTKIPKTPSYIKGVMNLRGAIVPVVDLRERFSIKAQQTRDLAVVVILNVVAEDRTRIIGAIVDDVSDVYVLADEQIKPTPDFGTAINTEFISGIATLEDHIVIVLNSNKLFSLEELSKLDELETRESD